MNEDAAQRLKEPPTTDGSFASENDESSLFERQERQEELVEELPGVIQFYEAARAEDEEDDDMDLHIQNKVLSDKTGSPEVMAQRSPEAEEEEFM